LGAYYLLFIKNPSSGNLKVTILNSLSRIGVDPQKVGFLQLNSGDVPTKPLKFVIYLEDQGNNFSYSIGAVINSEPVRSGSNSEYLVSAKSDLGQGIKIKIVDGVTSMIWEKKLWEERSGTVVEIIEEPEDSEQESLCGQEYCTPHESIKYLKAGDSINIHYYSEIVPKDAIKDNIYLTDAILSLPVTTITVGEAL